MVIAIIGILVALLLPAVQAAREAARRANCLNNIAQIPLAAYNYESAFGTLPPGAQASGGCCGAPAGANWAILILPHIEEQALFDQYDPDEAITDPTDRDGDGLNNEAIRRGQVSSYKCPSDQDTDQLVSPASGPGTSFEWSRGSYRAVAGSWNESVPNINCDWTSNPPFTQGNTPVEDWQGELFGDRLGAELSGLLPSVLTKSGGRAYQRLKPHSLLGPVELRRVTDGLSKTLMVGERSSVITSGVSTQCDDPLLDTFARQTMWAYGYTSYALSQLQPNSATLIPDTCRCAQVTDGEACKRGWGSLHPGGLHFALGDASARFITTDIDVDLLVDLGTIAGSEVIRSEF